MALDLQTAEQEIAEIYISTFGRAPDQAGLAYWVGEVMQGKLDVAQVAQSFFDQDETQSLYGSADDIDFLISIYENALGQSVDANDDGVQYWLDQLQGDGPVTRDSFIKTLINGAKAETGNPEDAQLLQNRVDAGLLYAKEVGVNSNLASQIISDITADAATAEKAMGTVDYYKGWVDQYAGALAPDAQFSEADLWEHIDDDTFWSDLASQDILNFDAPPTVNFWEQADAFWAPPPPGSEAVDPFAFLENEDAWHDPEKFTNFQDGAFRDVDPAALFAQYSAEASSMYGDLLNPEVMDAELMNSMFGNMDENLYKDIFDDMFGDVDDQYFKDVYSQDGQLSQDAFGDVDPFMFNQMFSNTLGDDAQYQEFFGDFDDSFIAGIYMDEDGKPIGEIPDGFNPEHFPDGFIDGFEAGEFSDEFFTANFEGQFPPPEGGYGEYFDYDGDGEYLDYGMYPSYDGEYVDYDGDGGYPDDGSYPPENGDPAGPPPEETPPPAGDPNPAPAYNHIDYFIA